MNETKVAYCCDFKDDCAGPGCSCHGGECSHTFNPEHAAFGPCEYPQSSSRFFFQKVPGVPAIWWEIGSAQDLAFAAAMDEKTERPELGTTEAAVRSCVNLIALATHTDEEHLAYWLDCYYQLRKAHEDRLAAEEARIQMERERREVLRSLLGRDDGPSRTPAPTEEDARATARVAPTEKIADGLPGGGPEGDKTWAEFREEAVEAPQPAARQMPHDVEAEESERPEAAAAQKKTGLR